MKKINENRNFTKTILITKYFIFNILFYWTKLFIHFVCVYKLYDKILK